MRARVIVAAELYLVARIGVGPHGSAYELLLVSLTVPKMKDTASTHLRNRHTIDDALVVGGVVLEQELELLLALERLEDLFEDARDGGVVLVLDDTDAIGVGEVAQWVLFDVRVVRVRHVRDEDGGGDRRPPLYHVQKRPLWGR